MSTMKSAIISDLDDNEVETATVFSGTAKAWANLNGSGTIALRGSFNIDSIVDNGLGDYTFNYISNMLNANYATSSQVARDVVSTDITTQHKGSASNPLSVSSVQISTTTKGNVAVDVILSTLIVHGDLA